MYYFLQMSDDRDVEGIRKVCQIYPNRNKLLWKNTYVNMWLKAHVGWVCNQIGDGNLDDEILIEKLTM